MPETNRSNGVSTLVARAFCLTQVSGVGNWVLCRILRPLRRSLSEGVRMANSIQRQQQKRESTSLISAEMERFQGSLRPRQPRGVAALLQCLSAGIGYFGGLQRAKQAWQRCRHPNSGSQSRTSFRHGWRNQRTGSWKAPRSPARPGGAVSASDLSRLHLCCYNLSNGKEPLAADPPRRAQAGSQGKTLRPAGHVAVLTPFSWLSPLTGLQ